MKFKSQLFIIFGMLLLSQLSFADAISHLNPKVQEKIRNFDPKGNPYAEFKNEGKPWRHATVYQALKATPEEAAALFFDYARHFEYFPNVTESKPRTPDPSKKNVTQIDYVLKLGKFGFIDLGIERYTTEDTLTQSDAEFGKAYQIQWHQVRADTMKSTDGRAYFEPTQQGNTLMVYDILIVPGQTGASLVAGRADQAVKDAMEKFTERLETFRTSQRADLDQEIQMLHSALE